MNTNGGPWRIWAPEIVIKYMKGKKTFLENGKHDLFVKIVIKIFEFITNTLNMW